MSPFNFVRSCSETKKYLFDNENEKEYLPYIVNMTFSMYGDCIFFANEMNKLSFLPKRMQYDFYFYVLDKKHRFEKWHKKDKIEDNLQMVADYFEYSLDKAKQILPLLSENTLKQIKEEMYKGGKYGI